MIKVDGWYAYAYDMRMQINLDLRSMHRFAVLASVDVVAAQRFDIGNL